MAVLPWWRLQPWSATSTSPVLSLSGTRKYRRWSDAVIPWVVLCAIYSFFAWVKIFSFDTSESSVSFWCCLCRGLVVSGECILFKEATIRTLPSKVPGWGAEFCGDENWVAIKMKGMDGIDSMFVPNILLNLQLNTYRIPFGVGINYTHYWQL